MSSKRGSMERKYKPWRRGRSINARSSAKQELRKHERLLAKLVASSQQPNEQPHDDHESNDLLQRRRALEERIAALRIQVEAKQRVDRQRKHARESHGVRFLERQRLTRMERATRNLFQSASSPQEKDRYQQELQRIALDQVYVAHYPHDVRYLPLFRNGVRVVDVVKKKRNKRAITRRRILKNLKSEQHVSWIAPDQYERVPDDWSIEREAEMFSAVDRETVDADTDVIDDGRFSLSQNQVSMVEAAEQMEIALEKEEEEREEKQKLSDASESSVAASSSSSDDSNRSDIDKADPLVRTISSAEHAQRGPPSSSTESSDDSSSSSSSRNINDDDDDESESNSSRNEDDQDRLDVGPEDRSAEFEKQKEASDEFDDFFTTSEQVDAFKQAKEDAPYNDWRRGDKSQGWATQKQRPGQFKKRRRARNY